MSNVSLCRKAVDAMTMSERELLACVFKKGRLWNFVPVRIIPIPQKHVWRKGPPYWWCRRSPCMNL